MARFWFNWDRDSHRGRIESDDAGEFGCEILRHHLNGGAIDCGVGLAAGGLVLLWCVPSLGRPESDGEIIEGMEKALELAGVPVVTSSEQPFTHADGRWGSTWLVRSSVVPPT